MYGPACFTADEMRDLMQALQRARYDIWQHMRVAEYNLTGKDPNFPDDKSDGPPPFHKLVHRDGIDASASVVALLEEVTKTAHIKSYGKCGQLEFTPNLPEDFGYYWLVKSADAAPRMVHLCPGDQYDKDSRSIEAWHCPGIGRHRLDAHNMPAWMWIPVAPAAYAPIINSTGNPVDGQRDTNCI